MIKRFIPLVVIVALLLPCLLLPASAVTDGFLDYNDFITDVEVDGENDLVTFEIPINYSYIRLFARDNSVTYGSRIGFLNEDITSSNMYRLYLYPWDSSTPLSLENLPDNTELTFKFDIIVNIPKDTSSWYTDLSAIQVDSRINTVSSAIVRYEVDLDSDQVIIPQEITYYVNKANGATGVIMLLDVFNLHLNSGDNITIRFYPTVVTTSISSMYRLPQAVSNNTKTLQKIEQKLEEQGIQIDKFITQQEITNDKLDGIGDQIGDTNDKLDNIGDQIGDTNSKLDEIIEGTVSPEFPDGSDAVGDLNDKEQELLDKTEQGRDEFNSYVDSAIGALSTHFSAFALMTMVFNSFVNLGWLRSIFVFSLSLGVFGFLCNIAFRVAGDGRRRSSKGGAE